MVLFCLIPSVRHTIKVFGHFIMNTFRASFNFELHWHPLRCRRQSPFIASTENSDKKNNDRERRKYHKHKRFVRNTDDIAKIVKKVKE